MRKAHLTMRGRNGVPAVTDRPVAETKEPLAGPSVPKARRSEDA
jgi:hypothetical protein